MNRLALATTSAAVTVAAIVVGGISAPSPQPAAAEAPAAVPSKAELPQRIRVTPPGEYTLPPAIPEEYVATAADLAGVVDFNDDEYAGSYWAPEVKQNIVVATSPAAAARIQAQYRDLNQAHVGIELRPYSLADLSEMGEQLSRERDLIPHGDQIVMVAPDPHTDGLSVYTSKQLGRGAMNRLAATVPVSVHFYPRFPPFRHNARHLPIPDASPPPDIPDPDPRAESRLHDPSPYSGGMKYHRRLGGKGDETCSMAFGYKEGGNQFVLTAGHCYELNTGLPELWAGDGVQGAEFGNRTTITGETGRYVTRRTSSDNDYHGDVSLVNATKRGHTVGTRMWVGGTQTTTKWPVVSRTAPAVGSHVCYGGLSSGDQCGFHITDTNTTLSTSSLHLHPVDYAVGYHRPFGGDSGGPVFRYVNGDNVEAVGVLSAAYPGLHSYPEGIVFTGAEEAMQAWGGVLDMQ